jgi:hypothetical protein
MEKEVMRTNNMKLETLETFTVRLACGFASIILLLLLLCLVLVVGFANSSFAQDAQPKAFVSPGEATNALFEAAQKEDEPALEAILGAGKEVTSSSDEVADKLEREQFCQKYQEMHRLVREPDGTTVLYIGAENWPFPIPLVSKNGTWYFDSETGKEDILYRRVGENEATAIEVCDGFAMQKKQNGPKAVSDDPIDEYAHALVTASTADNSAHPTWHKEPDPFHGYYFRIAIGSSTLGTPSGGKKTGSLVLIAYPAEYRSSGVMTFIVTQDGVVYEKDLGPSTTKVAPSIRVRSSSWHTAE